MFKGCKTSKCREYATETVCGPQNLQNHLTLYRKEILNPDRHYPHPRWTSKWRVHWRHVYKQHSPGGKNWAALGITTYRGETYLWNWPNRVHCLKNKQTDKISTDIFQVILKESSVSKTILKMSKVQSQHTWHNKNYKIWPINSCKLQIAKVFKVSIEAPGWHRWLSI